jgi:hypothetical protein
MTLSLLKATEHCFDFGVSCELAMYWLDYSLFDKFALWSDAWRIRRIPFGWRSACRYDQMGVSTYKAAVR